MGTLNNRKGFDHWWYNIEAVDRHDVKKEAMESIADVVKDLSREKKEADDDVGPVEDLKDESASAHLDIGCTSEEDEKLQKHVDQVTATLESYDKFKNEKADERFLKLEAEMKQLRSLVETAALPPPKSSKGTKHIASSK